MSDERTRGEVVRELVGWARLPCPLEDFAGGQVLAGSPSLHARAVAAFGSWELALAAALLEVCAPADELADGGSAGRLEDAPRPERVVTSAAEHPVYLFTEDGTGWWAPLTSFLTRPTGALYEVPAGPGIEQWPRAVRYVGDDPSVALLTRLGMVGTMLQQQLRSWSPDSMHVPVHRHLSGLPEDDGFVELWPRRLFRYDARVYAVTVDGQVKASSCDEYSKRLSGEAVEAVLLREGDSALALLTGPERVELMLASSLGKAIVFDASELRTQGRKAQGVRGISLDEGARVVSAFRRDGVEQVLLVTRQGYAKRMLADEFRAQGRGGGGLQTCRLGPGDEVRALVPVHPADDVLLLSDDGRYARMPVWDVPLMGRAARGERVFELGASEVVQSVVAVPPGPM